MKGHLAGVLAGTLIWTAPLAAERSAADPDLPSIELLEYLADFEEDEQGRLLDPLEQADGEQTVPPRRPGSRNDWEGQSDQ